MAHSEENMLHARPMEILALLPTGVAIGILTGILTNAINGWVSPLYFQKIFPDWPADEFIVWLTSIGQGVLEGAISGLATSVILVIAVSLISQLRCSFRLGLTLQAKVAAFSLLLWIVGGCNGVLIERFIPVVFELFIRLPAAPNEALKFAWVGGSIGGLYFGAMISLVGTIFSFARKWRQIEKQAHI